MRLAKLLLAGVFAVSGCHGCGPKDRVASVAALSGLVETDDAAPALSWMLASPDQSLVLGEAIRTGSHAQATLALEGGGRLLVRERSVVRFSAQPRARNGFRVGVELGEAEVESGDSQISFDTLFGAATIEAGTRVRLQGAAGGGLRFQVVVGSATVENSGRSTRVAQGQTFVVDVGGAVIEDVARAPVVAPPPPREVAPVAPEVVEPAVDNAPNAEGVATVVQGEGTRVRSGADTSWRALEVGRTRLAEGTRVSVPEGSTVEVYGEHGTALVRGAAEFVVGGELGAVVNTATGNVLVTSTQDTRVQVPGGAIVVRGATNLDVSREGTRVDVRSGTASLEGAQRLTLEAGNGTTLRRDGTLPAEETEEHAAGRAEFSIDAGENAAIHDPNTPTVARVRFTCPADGVVEVARGGSFSSPSVARGHGSANILLPVGSHRYRVRCANGDAVDAAPVAGGTLRVIRDSGTQSPPRNAPRTNVETDGRRYTVLFQTKLPEITVSWPRAPQAAGYVLNVSGPNGRNQEVRSATPTTMFASGRIVEGTYTLTWQTADAASRSRPTTLTLDFDDDTPVAYLRSPAPGDAISGTVHVEGIAQEGSSASANGHALSVDRARFRGDVAAPADECLAVRIAHPERGVHYYLRCGGRP